MIERICVNCRQANPVVDSYCGGCGQSLNNLALAPIERREIVARQNLPAILSIRLPAPVKKAAAVGLLSILANAGISLLRHQWQRKTKGALSPRKKNLTSQSRSLPAKSNIIFAQRVIENWRLGKLRHRVTEQLIIHEQK